VVGEGQRFQTEPCRLLDQLLRVGGPVEEAEVGVAVQLGVRDACHGHIIERTFYYGNGKTRRGRLVDSP